MTSGAIPRSQDSNLPKIHHFGEVTSTFDVAFLLAKEGRLPDWDSVIARAQTEGRGQLRRRWDSPPGNLYASLRLPLSPPFDTSAASVAIGALCANALRTFGCPVELKWPNDLVIERKEGFAKLGGVLVEERFGCLLAGIGINIRQAPDIPRSAYDYALPAANLHCDGKNKILPTPGELWQTLVRHFYSIYKSGSFFPKIWIEAAEDLLVWRGEMVIMEDSRRSIQGILKGLCKNGGALLDVGGRMEEVTSGRMRRADDTHYPPSIKGKLVDIPGKTLIEGESFED